MIQNENFSYSAWEYIGSFVAVKIPRLFSRFYLGVSFGVCVGVVIQLFVPRGKAIIFLNFLKLILTINRKTKDE
jgi:hypothetical protein|tara:strand:+ start:117 stop:338 length:222 start_codon:yes stop_codon:yes gene_type:complete